ncbi:MAG TPA: KH domain-containing protein [bacterium]|jgi:hypothetical protein|nr:KH domain-containing protein [bacterium]
MSDMQDKDFLEMIVKAIVGHPDKVSVDRTVDEMGVLLTLKTDPEDMGYVIGRRGQTAQAIRTLLKIVGAKNNARVNLKIYEPEGSVKPPRRERERDTNFGQQQTPAQAHAQALADVDTSAIDDIDNLTI